MTPMSPRSARVRRAATVVLRPGLGVGLALALVLALVGCGSSSSSEKPRKPEGPSKAVLDCRQEWTDLGEEIADREERTNPAALAPRWNSISAAIDHYSGAAKASDCDQTLEDEKAAVTALNAFSAKLARFDMELRLEQVRDDAARYASGPRPPAPKASPSKKGKKGKKRPPRPPKPSEVAAALKTLTRQAPLATEQQGPGWQQARDTDPTDAKAVKKAVKDLDFLSEESKAYRAAREALGTIRRALAATPD